MIRITRLLLISVFLIYFFVTFFLLVIYPASTFMGIFPFLTNIIFVGLFLIALSNSITMASKTKYNLFLKNIFWYSQFYCLAYICLQFLLSYCYTPELFPYDIGITDNYEYITNGSFFNLVLKDERSMKTFLALSGISDQGFPIWCGTIFYIFGDGQLVVKLLNAIVTGITVILVVKTVRIVLNERIAKLSGILYAFIPTVAYISGFFLKESLMMFLVSISIYNVVLLLKELSVFRFCVLFFAILSIFFFRGHLAAIVLFSCMCYFLINGKMKIVPMFVCFISLVLVLNDTYIMDSIQSELLGRYNEINADEQYFQEKMEQSSALSKLGLVPLLPLATLFPLPSFLDLRSSFNIQSMGILYRIHVDLIRIILMFWGGLGTYYIVKHRKIKILSIFLIPFIIQIIVNAMVGVLTYYRYQFTIILFLVPIMAYGINYFCLDLKRNLRLYRIYVIVVFFIILVYNVMRTNFVEL